MSRGSLQLLILNNFRVVFLQENRHGGGNELSVNVEDAVEECELLCSEKDVDEELLAFYEKTIRHKLERSRFY